MPDSPGSEPEAVEADGARAATDHTVSFEHANVAGLALFLVAVVVVIGAFVAIWGLPSHDAVRELLRNSWLLALAPVPVIVVSTAVHEGLHALGFRLFGGVPWRSIRFGIHWRLLTPYAGTAAPMPARGYRWAAALPGLALGLAPTVAGLAMGSGWLTSYGAFMLGAAGGDAIALWAMRHVPPGARVRDAVGRVGCEVLVGDDGTGDTSEPAALGPRPSALG
jgi:hypothetical protein